MAVVISKSAVFKRKPPLMHMGTLKKIRDKDINAYMRVAGKLHPRNEKAAEPFLQLTRSTVLSL